MCLSTSSGTGRAERCVVSMSSSPPAAGDGRAPASGQCAGTLALDCLLPGPPSVTVSSHGHRRLAPPQDHRLGRPPRLGPLCPQRSRNPELAAGAAAVLGADPERRRHAPGSAPAPHPLRGAAGPHAHSHGPRGPSARLPRPRPLPPTPAAVTSACPEPPRCRQRRAPRPRVSRATVAFDCYCGNRR
nr:uncharacterized protein LOC111752490 [Loxodonta africana]